VGCPLLTNHLHCLPLLQQLSLAKSNAVRLAFPAPIHHPLASQPPQTLPGSHQHSRARCCFAAMCVVLTGGLFSLRSATLRAGRVLPSQPTHTRGSWDAPTPLPRVDFNVLKFPLYSPPQPPHHRLFLPHLRSKGGSKVSHSHCLLSL